jgi:hypothetical protein
VAVKDITIVQDVNLLEILAHYKKFLNLQEISNFFTLKEFAFQFASLTPMNDFFSNLKVQPNSKKFSFVNNNTENALVSLNFKNIDTMTQQYVQSISSIKKGNSLSSKGQSIDIQDKSHSNLLSI